ncbi:restriction endonuclease [Loktanella sp. DJP18]|uniref:restriction endonuclease n=1 Tax=Loktanella sp. DJP18 TaxID=3409788 RepID=UPI003BB4D09E
MVKIQCKQTIGQHSNAEVNQLLGRWVLASFGLFVTLGSFSRAATEFRLNKRPVRRSDD